jgi:ribosome biogenesis GTPase
MDLVRLGWTPYFEQHFAPHREQGLEPARVVCQHRHYYLVRGTGGEQEAEAPGRMHQKAQSPGELPAVGDWVGLRASSGAGRAIIEALLPRRTAFSRLKGNEQVMAANVDVLFLVSGLDNTFNLRRIERYLTLAWNSGADPVIVLNKADLCADLETRLAQVQAISCGAPVHAISALESLGLDQLRPYLSLGRTAALAGPSGVGKSTLVNALLGEERLPVQQVRERDGKGRHTTAHRELIALPDGGLLIDSPGTRELGLWGEEESLTESFADIEALAAGCRFADCQHHAEPGCRVQEAVRAGDLEGKRVESYRKLRQELEGLERRLRRKEQLAERARKKKTDKRARRKKERRAGQLGLREEVL